MMDARMTPMNVLGHFLHRHLLALLLASYAAAALLPALGLWIKDTRPLSPIVGVSGAGPTVPALMLAFLLFHAGLRVRWERVRRMARRPSVLLAGLTANLALPVVYLLGLIPVLQAWHNPSESGTILLGLALVAAMPVAGSSTGWAQSTGGDMALSLGLVLLSTVLSPLTTPLALELLGVAAPAGYDGVLRRLASRDAGVFLAAWVLMPSLCGMGLRAALGGERASVVEERLKPLSPLVLLVLCYTNASACLPQALGTPDWDFLLVTLGCVLGLCVIMFTAGYLIARVFGTDQDQKAALIFGLGMNNNGTGQVLASVALSSHPLVLLPIIVYNLSQHIAAGCAHALLHRPMEQPRDGRSA